MTGVISRGWHVCAIKLRERHWWLPTSDLDWREKSFEILSQIWQMVSSNSFPSQSLHWTHTQLAPRLPNVHLVRVQMQSNVNGHNALHPFWMCLWIASGAVALIPVESATRWGKQLNLTTKEGQDSPRANSKTSEQTSRSVWGSSPRCRWTLQSSLIFLFRGEGHTLCLLSELQYAVLELLCGLLHL